MGCGKSTAALLLKENYKMDLAEMDQLIAEREGLSIPAIFEKHGEEYFRAAETELLRELCQRDNTVISCGGGVAMRECNVELMRGSGRIILLTATPRTILYRLKDNHDRPLLEKNKSEEAIEALMESRRPRYEAAADVVINTDGKSPEEICRLIMDAIIN